MQIKKHNEQLKEIKKKAVDLQNEIITGKYTGVAKEDMALCTKVFNIEQMRLDEVKDAKEARKAMAQRKKDKAAAKAAGQKTVKKTHEEEFDYSLDVSEIEGPPVKSTAYARFGSNRSPSPRASGKGANLTATMQDKDGED